MLIVRRRRRAGQASYGRASGPNVSPTTRREGRRSCRGVLVVFGDSEEGSDRTPARCTAGTERASWELQANGRSSELQLNGCEVSEKHSSELPVHDIVTAPSPFTAQSVLHHAGKSGRRELTTGNYPSHTSHPFSLQFAVCSYQPRPFSAA